MLRYLDRALSVLLLLGAAAHTWGVMRFYAGQPHPLFWSLTEGLLVVLLAAINLLRTDRPTDRGVAWVATLASASYIVVIIGFGRLVDNMLDVRVISFGLVSLGLTLFGLRTLFGKVA